MVDLIFLGIGAFVVIMTLAIDFYRSEIRKWGENE